MKNHYSEAARIVPCGKCVLCLKRRQNAWAFRLEEETKVSISACFITLTYAVEPISMNGHPTLLKSDFQKFMKRLRKQLNNQGIKYYACGEYGEKTYRPHYHAIMFNLPPSWLQDSEKLTRTWAHGHVDISPNTTATMRYVTKYIMKGRHNPEHIIDIDTGEIILEDDRFPPFSLMSKKMGLAHLTPAMLRHYKEKLISYVTLPGGTATALPRYFRNKIFTKEERAILTIAANEAREINFKKLFNNDSYKELIWKKDIIRKNDKSVKQRATV